MVRSRPIITPIIKILLIFVGILSFVFACNIGRDIPATEPVFSPPTLTSDVQIAHENANILHTSTPQPTATPGIDYNAQIAELEAQRAELEREKAELQAAAEQQIRDIETAQKNEQHIADLSIKQAEIDRLIAETRQIIKITEMEAESKSAEIERENLKAEIERNNIDIRQKGFTYIAWGGGALAIILTMIGLLIAFRFVYWNLLDAYERERDEQSREQYHKQQLAEIEMNRKAAAHAARVAEIAAFVADAIKINGEEDHQVPANTKMDGYNAEGWSRIVEMLKADGKVYTSNHGTFLNRGTLGDLRDELVNGYLPTSRAEIARVRFLSRNTEI